MLKQLANRVFGTRFDRELKRIQPIIDKIHEHEERLSTFSDDEVRAQTDKLRDLLHEQIGDLEASLIVSSSLWSLPMGSAASISTGSGPPR